MAIKIDSAKHVIHEKKLLSITKQFHSEIDQKLSNKEYGFFMKKDKAKWYYNKSRIGFYFDLFHCIKSNGIEFNAKRIMDFACGGGYLLRVIEENSSPQELHGIDYLPDAVEFANLILTKGQVMKGNILEPTNKIFDIIIATEVLEHVVDPDTIINNLWSNTSKKNGALIITVPDGRLDRLDALELNEKTGSYSGHINFWSPESFYYYINKIFYKVPELKSNLTAINVYHIPDRYNNYNNKVCAIILKAD